MEFTYKKNNNEKLFNNFNNIDSLNLYKVQNYIPLYKKFFDLNENNYQNVNLNNKIKLESISSKISSNIFNCKLNNNNNIKESKVFFKYSPLLDPSKYLIGKYEKDNYLELPKINSSIKNKINDTNNSAYVDGFFSYLTSQLLHYHNFINATDFYGSYIGIKRDFEYNIIDDLECLNESEFFHKNNNSLFKIKNEFANQLINLDTRNNKQRLKIENNNLDIEINSIDELNNLNKLFSVNQEVGDPSLDLLYSFNLKEEKSDNSSNDECSSTSSKTSISDSNETYLEDNESESDISTASEDTMLLSINDFPVKVIALEKCDNTLDSLIVEKNEEMSDLEWGSIIFQIIIILYTYQKTFNMTHNDLHSNNIMYIKTDKQFLYYKVKNNYYKVPTFGRIFKFIDFGRAIYKFRGKVMCSDSYHKDGDAATLYNCEPYMNENKPRLEPNYSFDLCRLGCSLLDFFIDELDENPNDPSLAAKRIIAEWCIDDKDRNILYKKNMRERYPDFKLYKMIARTVHNHTPEKQLEKEYFNKFKISKKKINKNHKIVNIDNIPSYI
jgi:hypothetical protein